MLKLSEEWLETFTQAKSDAEPVWKPVGVFGGCEQPERREWKAWKKEGGGVSEEAQKKINSVPLAGGGKTEETVSEAVSAGRARELQSLEN